MQTEIRYDLCSFQTLALKPGGKPRELALRDAVEAVTALSGKGQVLIRTNVEFLSMIGQTLADDTTGLDKAYRKAVEIAQVASFLQMTMIAEVAQSLSELVFRMIAADAHEPESYAVHIQALKLAISAGESSHGEGTANLLIARLGKVVAQIPDPDGALKQGHNG